MSFIRQPARGAGSLPAQPTGDGDGTGGPLHLFLCSSVYPL